MGIPEHSMDSFHIRKEDTLLPRPAAPTKTKGRPPSLDLTVARCRCSGCGCVSSREANKENEKPQVEADAVSITASDYSFISSVNGQEGDETISERCDLSGLERSLHKEIPMQRFLSDSVEACFHVPFDAGRLSPNNQGSLEMMDVEPRENDSINLSTPSLPGRPTHDPNIFEEMGAWVSNVGVCMTGQRHSLEAEHCRNAQKGRCGSSAHSET